jgi:hypothetical protein
LPNSRRRSDSSNMEYVNNKICQLNLDRRQQQQQQQHSHFVQLQQPHSSLLCADSSEYDGHLLCSPLIDDIEVDSNGLANTDPVVAVYEENSHNGILEQLHSSRSSTLQGPETGAMDRSVPLFFSSHPGIQMHMPVDGLPVVIEESVHSPQFYDATSSYQPTDFNTYPSTIISNYEHEFELNEDNMYMTDVSNNVENHMGNGSFATETSSNNLEAYGNMMQLGGVSPLNESVCAFDRSENTSTENELDNLLDAHATKYNTHAGSYQLQNSSDGNTSSIGSGALNFDAYTLDFNM